MTGDAQLSPQRSGVYLAPEDTEALRAAAGEARLKWFDLNLARVETKADFLAVCRKSLRLPRHFGGNWDALADCLKDLCADSVVNCRNAERFAASAPEDYATALEVLQDAAAFWQERGSAFIALVDAEPEGVRVARLAGPKDER